MEEIRNIQKKYCSQAIFFAIAVTILFIILDQKPIGKGFLLGTLFSILNFIIMGQLIPLKLAKSRSKASLLAFSSVYLRLGILAVPLIISIKIDSFNFIGAVIGIFMIQLTILFNHLILDRLSFKSKA